MKYRYILISLGSLLVMLAIYSAYTIYNAPKTPDAPNVTVTVISDSTDKLSIIPSSESILTLYKYDADIKHSASFRFTTISDKVLNPSIEFNLDCQSVTDEKNKTGESKHREKLILTFYRRIRQLMYTYNKKYPNLRSNKNSECYRVICDELTLLAKNKGSTKYLLVFSDLFENSNLLESYTATGSINIAVPPERIATDWQTKYPLPDSLQGINVYFFYKPQTREQDIAFQKILKVYQLLLEPRGVKVVVQASNIGTL